MRITLTRDGKFIKKENTGVGPIDYTAAVEFLAWLFTKDANDTEKLNKEEKR